MLEIDGSRYTGILKYTTVGDRIEMAWRMRDRKIERDSPSLAKSLRNAVMVRCGSVAGAWVDGAGWQASFDPGSQFDKLVSGDAFSYTRDDVFAGAVEPACGGVNVFRRNADDRANPWEAWQ